MDHVTLIGDSIFDNGPYVGEGESVSEILSNLVVGRAKVTLLAVDGDVTTDVPQQLDAFPDNTTHAFVSCGGNDALRIIDVLDRAASSVGEALDILTGVREKFRINYTNMLKAILKKTPNLVVCTVYNSVPGTSNRALSALALFNEIILQEATKLHLPIIDLRNICTEESDYSALSPIEPSGKGAEKIVKVINSVLVNHDFTSKMSVIYS